MSQVGTKPSETGRGGSNHAVRVSHLSDGDVQRLKQAIETFALNRKDASRDAAIGAVPSYFESKLLVHVAGYGNVAPYVRAAPGAKRIVDVLGKESFAAFGALLAVGLQAYEDSKRNDLDSAQRLGRASSALLVSAVGAEVTLVCPPLGLVLIGLSIAFSPQIDKFTAFAFSDRDPAVRAIGAGLAKIATLPVPGRRGTMLIDLW
jgi:hypothetical protein